jgi:hypothetical protein
MPYHPGMAPPPFVVAVVGSHDTPMPEIRTAAWVTGRDIAWAGAWLAVDVGGAVAAAVAAGAREHDGVVLGFTSYAYRAVTVADVDVSMVIRTAQPSPLHAAVMVENVDALLALPGDSRTLAAIAAAHERGIPVAQIGTTDWPADPLTPTEVPAWLDVLTNPAAPAADPPAPPVLDPTGPQRTPTESASASVFASAESTPSSSSTASDATSSPSPTTPTSEPASSSATPTG